MDNSNPDTTNPTAAAQASTPLNDTVVSPPIVEKVDQSNIVTPKDVSDAAPASNSKMIIIIIGILVLALIAMAGGAYWYISSQQSQTPVPVATPEPTKTEDEKSMDEVNAIEDVNVDTDFIEVDQDLNTL